MNNLLKLLVLPVGLFGCVYSAEVIPAARHQPWVNSETTAQLRKEATSNGGGDTAESAGSFPTPMDLSQCLDWGLRHNPRTEQSYRQAVAAAAAKGQAWAAYYPDISAQFPLRHERTENVGMPFPVKRTVSETSVAVTMTLLDFGTRAGAIDEARANVAAASLLHNRSIQEVIFGVTKRYFDLNAAHSALAADQESLADTVAHERVVERSVTVGLKPRVELLQATAQRRAAELKLEESKAAIEDARAALSIELGVSVDNSVAIVPVSITPRPQQGGVAVSEYIETALRSRPDLMAAYADAVAAGGNSRRIRSKAWPELVAQGRWSEGNPHGSVGKEENYAVGVAVEVPLFSGFANSYAADRAAALEAAARARAAQLEHRVAAEVWQSFFAVQSSERRLEAALALRSAAEEAYRVLQRAYETGAQALVDVLGAQAELSAARKAVVAAEAGYAVAIAQLALATGEPMPKEGES